MAEDSANAAKIREYYGIIAAKYAAEPYKIWQNILRR